MQMTSRGKCGTSEHIVNGNGDSEASKRKSPLRVEGEWSEYVSSKGLVYYYHCRTEVSQWQRPHEWTLPSMSQDEIKRKLATKSRNGVSSNVKRNCQITVSQDLTSSPKRIKYSNQQSNEEKRVPYNTNITKYDLMKCTKVTPQTCNVVYSNNMKNKNTEANFNNDDMDISPSSSPLSRGSHSDEFDRKNTCFTFESIKSQMPEKLNSNLHNTSEKMSTSPGFIECSSSTYSRNNRNFQNTYKYQENGMAVTNLSQYQQTLASTLRSTMLLLQARNTDNKYEICLSVAHISELLTRFEAVLNNGGTVHSYRSHRLQTQLLHNSSYSNSQDPKTMTKVTANIFQIKELVKYIQDFIQENYPHSISSFTPVSPNYSKPVKIQYYMQMLHNLIETCLLQLSPQSLTSPSSTSSPGSLKDNNSTISVSTYINSHLLVDPNSKPEIDSPIKKEKSEADKPKSVLHDSEMLKFVSSDISNTYRNQLADCYVQEAQVEYYKFVRLHSVLYPELACESKKLKALVRISEINTELFKHKKEDLEKLVHMLELRRLPNHLKCDYLPPPFNS